MANLLFLGITAAMLGKAVLGLLGAAGVFGLQSLFKKSTPLANSDKEAAELSLRNQQILNEQEYERKKEFYEMYESPEAMVRQYSSAGLNPMLLAGGGASVSASGGIGSAGSAAASASSSSSDIAGMLSDLVGTSARFELGSKQVRVQEKRNEIDFYNAQTSRMMAEADIAYKNSLATGQNTTNEWLSTIYGNQVSLNAARERNYDSMTAMNDANKQRLLELVESEKVNRELTRHKINLVDKEAACAQYQSAILEAQSKYSDEYFKALSDLQAIEALRAQGEYGIFERTLDTREKAAIAELNHVIIRAGMDARIFTGKAFERHVEGKQTSGELLSTWTNFGKSIISAGITGAAIVGSGFLRSASRAITPPVFPGTMPQSRPMMTDVYL